MKIFLCYKCFLLCNKSQEKNKYYNTLLHGKGMANQLYFDFCNNLILY